MTPKIVILFTSYRCNSRCIMCSAWAKQQYYYDLSVQQIEKIFSDSLLRKNIEIVNLTGGEPTLRKDLVDIVKVFLNTCRSIRRIDIPTNGINSDEVVDKIERILAVLLPTNIKLCATVSLDGIGEIHEKVRGVSNIFFNIDRTIRELKELSEIYPFFSININTTISQVNVDGLAAVLSYAHSLGIGVNYTLAAISEIGVESISARNRFEIINKDKKEIVIDFFEKLMNQGLTDKNYAKFVIAWLKTGKRSIDCSFKRGSAFLLEPDGEAYLCGNFKKFRIGNLLKEPFEKAWEENNKISKKLSNQCLQCTSNCYVDEII